MSRLSELSARPVAFVRSVHELTVREKKALLAEILHVRGLMPLLMKPRNKQRWTPEDKAELAVHLERLSRISPYLVVLVMPGGFFMLPALAWWLDRRRLRKQPPAAPVPPV
jgi:hypothetical protein